MSKHKTIFSKGNRALPTLGCFIRWAVRRPTFSATALVLVSLAIGLPAAGQSVGGDGSFSANFVGYADTGVEPLQIGPGRVVGITNSTLTAMSVENAIFLDNQTGRCIGTWTVDEISKTFEQLVHCTYTDLDGDHIFEEADFDRQPLDAPRVGTGRWLGGTGKYSGLSGVFEIRTRTLRSAREGIVQYVGTKHGQYRLRSSE